MNKCQGFRVQFICQTQTNQHPEADFPKLQQIFQKQTKGDIMDIAVK